jgi:GNAT superfamily N-acetyltransferase
MHTENRTGNGIAFAVRRAHLNDLDAVIHLLDDLDYQIQERERLECLWEDVFRDNTAWGIFVAVQSGKPVGFVTVNVRPALRLGGRVASIEELVVEKRFRGSGVGSALLDGALSFADSLDCLRIEVLSSRRRESYKRSFYAKRGFSEHPSAIFRKEKRGRGDERADGHNDYE